MSINKRGATLLETLLSTGIFSLLVVALFVFYSIGKTKWNVMFLRYTLQTDARRAMGDVERDLRKTDYSSIDVYSNPRVTPAGWTDQVPRWAVCSISLSDWTNPKNFDPASGKPLWNQYVIYMATTETGRGGAGPQGGAGSGRFLKLVANFAVTPTNPLPLHFPAFVPTVNWVNNEFSVIQQDERLGIDKLLLSGFFPGPLVATATVDPGFSNPNTNQPPPSQPGNPIVDQINNDANAGLDSKFSQDLTNAIAATNPPFAVNSVKVSYVADVFAFRVDKDDVNRVVGVTYKTRGFVNRTEHGGAAYESRQLGVYVQPGVNHAK